MKVSNLINKLQNIQNKEGDIDVYFSIEEDECPVKSVKTKKNDFDYIGTDKIINLR